MKFSLYGCVSIAATVLQLSPAQAATALAAAPCERVKFADMSYSVCRYPNEGSGKPTFRTFWKSKAGTPYGTLLRLKNEIGPSLLFACNGSAAQADLTPVGLYVEDSKEQVPIVGPKDEGLGNIFIRPNGVFFVEGKRANVLTTDEYMAAKPSPNYANQSGPMLVVNGDVSARLDQKGTSLKTRNAVCVNRDRSKLIFAVSEGPLNFFTFATYLKSIGCLNALNLDVTGSSVYAPSIDRADLWIPLGPILAVVK